MHIDFKRRQLLFDSFQKLQQNELYTQQHVQQVQHQQNVIATTAPAKAAFTVEPSITSPSHAETTDVRMAKGTRVHTWGAGYHGQLASNDSRKKCRLQPQAIEFASEPVFLVACGGFHSALLTGKEGDTEAHVAHRHIASPLCCLS